MQRSWRLLAAVGVVASGGLIGCSEAPTALEGDVMLLSVAPQGGSVGVDPDASVVVTFDHAIMASMTAYAALHEGPVTGPEVAGAWSLSADGRVLTFTPAQALKQATSYTIHLGGGMEGEHGESMDFETHGAMHMGGQWATGGMMSGGMSGMDGSHPHMGGGWSHPNGTYGMTFTFTTAG